MADETSTFWSYEEAKRKCDERHSCFVEVEVQEHMFLSPYYIGRIKQGVQEQIEGKIRRWKFLDEHQGIIVAYDNIRLLQKLGSIDDETAFVHFDIKVNYIVFKPEVGQKLVGIVNKTSSSHVGCLVHGHFNASLARPKFCENGWIGERLVIGTEFVFRVVDLQTVAGVLCIVGQIKDKDAKYIKFNSGETTAQVDVTQSCTEESQGSEKKNKKSKNREVDNKTCEMNNKLKKKKSEQSSTDSGIFNMDNGTCTVRAEDWHSSLEEDGSRKTKKPKKEKSKHGLLVNDPHHTNNKVLKTGKSNANISSKSNEQNLVTNGSPLKRKLSNSPGKKHKKKRQEP